MIPQPESLKTTQNAYGGLNYLLGFPSSAKLEGWHLINFSSRLPRSQQHRSFLRPDAWLLNPG
jgi:hypothetical protein